jgi:hypothetical protein
MVYTRLYSPGHPSKRLPLTQTSVRATHRLVSREASHPSGMAEHIPNIARCDRYLQRWAEVR